MSSPLAKANKSSADQLLIKVHQRVSHSHRIKVLADAIAARIQRLQSEGAIPPAARILDVGCGDMTLADAIAAQCPGLVWQCVDVHPLNAQALERDSRWNRYRQFDGAHLDFSPGSFDVALFSDVLHHVPEGQRVALLRSAGQASRHVLVKDHFEYGPVSRQLLRLMDFVGNFGYGVSVPERYFDPDAFAALSASAGLAIEDRTVGMRLYDHIPIVRHLLSPRWQFMALLEAR